ncbi:hypothetical protein [Maridesulfovibrio ferrireducens]|uniref:hypothetical protein n=1 Tax=Maridesulfovibrio ferrireducens TaxID=246191 RepID=UPI001A20ED30|nr:hypothetical protein [Maridesulfovibrio ferrireducens]MBI9113257.1 hypothetical protein [Maridesulfovibrio ferrireducens]
MDRNPNIPKASARVHLSRKNGRGTLLTVTIIHQGKVNWHREKVSPGFSLAQSYDDAILHAAKRLEISSISSQLPLPFI